VADHADAKGYTKHEMAEAMQRLRDAGVLRVETNGPPSRRYDVLVAALLVQFPERRCVIRITASASGFASSCPLRVQTLFTQSGSVATGGSCGDRVTVPVHLIA
jgi:hypothetical protein